VVGQEARVSPGNVVPFEGRRPTFATPDDATAWYTRMELRQHRTADTAEVLASVFAQLPRSASPNGTAAAIASGSRRT
jgi:hypothetical protein